MISSYTIGRMMSRQTNAMWHPKILNNDIRFNVTGTALVVTKVEKGPIVTNEFYNKLSNDSRSIEIAIELDTTSQRIATNDKIVFDGIGYFVSEIRKEPANDNPNNSVLHLRLER